MTVAQLDEWLFDNLKEAFPKASDMELADLRIPRSFTCDLLRLALTLDDSWIHHVYETMDRGTGSLHPPVLHPKTYVPASPPSFLTNASRRMPALAEEYQKGRHAIRHHPLPLRHPVRRRRPQSENDGAEAAGGDRKGTSSPHLLSPITMLMPRSAAVRETL